MITTIPGSGGSGGGGLFADLASVLPVPMLGEILNSVGTLNPMGGLSGGPGLLQGLADEEVPNEGLTGIFDMLGLKGRLPKGWLATGRDAAPIVGSIFGNMFAPGIGGGIGAAAGSLGSSVAFGNEGDAWKNGGLNAPTVNFIS